MQLGLIGLGRMGGNMRERIRAAGHEVIGYDRNPDVSDVASIKEMVEKLTAPRAVWTMVPAGAITEGTIDELSELLSEGDVVIDGGNSKFTDDQPRAERLGRKGIGYMDCGVSGGIWGSQNGYALMVGGDPAHVQRVMPIFEALKPAGEFGFVHAGPVGAGHYTKMVHNGIEYGMMQALAEGWELLEASEYVDNVPGAIKSWREGSVVKSWLLDLLDRALDGDPELAKLKGYAEDTGEGRWTVDEAVRLAVPLHVIASSLFARFESSAGLAGDEGGRRAAPAVRRPRGSSLISRSHLRCTYAGSS
jgi:6-phosphogluconate dehydrogenase